MSEFETVFTVTEYYDGCRAGIANFRGEPHLYRSRYVDVDSDEDDVFALSPVDDETFRLALEDWAICERWQTAIQMGLADESTHAALPEERDRHVWLSRELARRVAPDESVVTLAKGEFRALPGQHKPRGVIRDVEVRWTIVTRSM